jgi:hypothetical protein
MKSGRAEEEEDEHGTLFQDVLFLLIEQILILI